MACLGALTDGLAWKRMAVFEDTLIESNIFAFAGIPRTSSIASVVQSWSNKEVLHWLEGFIGSISGIDSSVSHYSDMIEKSQIDGRDLLLLDEDAIYDMGITNFGVAKMIFQAIQILTDFCYNVGEENLQTLCLNVCVCVRQLECDIKNIQRSSQQQFSQSELISLNNILFLSVCQVIEQLKKVLVWLDRSPFDRVSSFIEFRSGIMQDCLSLLRAVCDPYLNKHFSEVVDLINEIAKSVYEKCDSIVTTSLDPMVCYTTSFETAVLRKTKDSLAWGFNLQSSYRGVHVVCEVKLLSPADACGEVDAGDEILQINGEMVLGWELRKVATRLSSFALNECCRELILFVNKRPREPTLVPRLPRPSLKVEATGARNFKRKPSALHTLLTEETEVIDERKKRSSKQESPGLSLPPDTAMTTSSTSTDLFVGETFFDNRIRLIRRATISCGTPPPQIPLHQPIDRSQSLTIALMMMGMEDELHGSGTREVKMTEETGMQVEMVIRRRRTMRQQPGGYVKSFVDNQPICELENGFLDGTDNKYNEEETESACTAVFVGKGPNNLDEAESEKEPERYAVIDVVDQCDLNLLNLPPLDDSEWSSVLHLSLSSLIDDQESLEREDSSTIGYTLILKITNFKNPIAETDETSLGWDSDTESEIKYPGNAQDEETAAAVKEECVLSNLLRDLSRIPCAELQDKQQKGWIRRKRLEHEPSSNKWIKCWMVLCSGVLYIYQNQYALQADIVIAVAKFIVSDAPELRTSKK
ncbi:unnamed protein product [Enterobius vermicularis]|uniref:PDZ domain-containing protein n=1 Tax=Enterobius vermicularis TaxID=51028 RepID=A0A0N4USL7_ENTVE|nr:unnamed protein product [Enterobius vermicularis]